MKQKKHQNQEPVAEIFLTEPQRVQAIELYEKRMSVPEIARLLQVPLAAVSKAVPGKNRRVTPEEIEEMRTLSMRGTSIRKIAVEFGFNYTTVCAWLSDNGKAQSARELRKNGVCIEAIADRLGATVKQVRAWTGGVVDPKEMDPRYTAAQLESIEVLWGRGNSITAIASLMDLSYDGVWKAVQRLGAQAGG